ncbi:hypothetical protein [Desulfovibrio sp. DV]|uniref:hypothetical protein n=1 Tax=Desulfovibrio sp. DV TaxID=1844708 RepID=UPI0011151423|nr:hypothetical protein [Desulfovibrio sp. DV]
MTDVTSAARHYITIGAKKGFNPHVFFDTEYYKLQAGIATEMNPLIHFIQKGLKERIDPHPLFCLKYYCAQSKKYSGLHVNWLQHYCDLHVLGYNPHPLFDTKYYHFKYADIPVTFNPLAHFLDYGAKELRSPSKYVDLEFYYKKIQHRACPSKNLLIDYLTNDKAQEIPISDKYDMAAFVQNYRHQQIFDFNLIKKLPDLHNLLVNDTNENNNSRLSPFRYYKLYDATPNCRITDCIKRISIYHSSAGNYFFKEFSDILQSAFSQLNVRCDIRTEREGFAEDVDYHIVIAPHEFFTLREGIAVADKIPENTIMLSTEQSETDWFKVSLKYLPKAKYIFDLSFPSAYRLTKLFPYTYFLPFGYLPLNTSEVYSLTPMPDCNILKKFSHATKQNSKNRLLNFSERPIDILFIGTSSLRREQFFLKNASFFSRYNCFFYVPPCSRPFVEGENSALNTRSAVSLCQRSKIILNIHRGSENYFEWQRIVMRGVMQKSLVMTEYCEYTPLVTPNLDFIQVNLETMPTAIDFFLNPENTTYTQSLLDAAYENMKKSCDFRSILKALFSHLKKVEYLALRSE